MAPAEAWRDVRDRQFEAAVPDPNRVAGFTYLRTGEGRLYVEAIIDLLSRRVAAGR